MKYTIIGLGRANPFERKDFNFVPNHKFIHQQSSIFIRYKRILLVVLMGFVLTCCSALKQSIPKKGNIEGVIYSIGNDPFTKLGLQTSDGIMYVLKCPKEIESELISKQGRNLKVQYDSLYQSPEGLIMKVVKIHSSPSPQ